MSNCPCIVIIKRLTFTAQILKRVIYTHFFCFHISHSILHILIVNTNETAEKVSLLILGPAIPSNLINMLGVTKFFHNLGV